MEGRRLGSSLHIHITIKETSYKGNMHEGFRKIHKDSNAGVKLHKKTWKWPIKKENSVRQGNTLFRGCWTLVSREL